MSHGLIEELLHERRAELFAVGEIQRTFVPVVTVTCVDCGLEFEVKAQGGRPERCRPHARRQHLDRQRAYAARKHAERRQEAS